MPGLFTIPIGGLKAGLHSYDFEISKGFFEQFEESEVKDGDLRVVVLAEKRSSHLDLDIRIKGMVSVPCDRCLGMLQQPLDIQNRLLVKFGRTHDESDPEIFTVPSDENELDLKQYFYESILLALPIQRVHPPDENGNATCDRQMLDKLKEHLVGDGNESPDPRWDELKKIMNNN